MSTTTTAAAVATNPAVVAGAAKALKTKAPAKTTKAAAKPATKAAAKPAKVAGEIPKSVAKRLARKRFSFGPVWNHAVVAGTVTDEAKLKAQAEQLQIALPANVSFDDLKAAVALHLIESGALNETAETAAA